jgi:endonuclease/exonuclease/phosphatase family metal-dependent hydrolase
MRTFRAATLNIWGRFGPCDERMVAIRESLRALAPDVIGLQEVVRVDGFDQGALLSDGLGYSLLWGRASEEHGLPLGNAILSKWPILRTEVIALPNGGTEESRCLLFAELEAPFGKVPFFCTHLNWKLHEGYVRCLQVKAITLAIDRIVPREPLVPPVLVGDFNAEPDADEIRYLRGLTGLGGPTVYFADAFAVAGDGSRGTTFSKTNPFAEVLREPERRIDYVFVRSPDDARRGEPLDASVCFDKAVDGTFPSDHYGVVATICAGR